jgi:Ser-tRNA(Ala) deacylase AlaX
VQPPPAYDREPYRRELDVRVVEVGAAEGRSWARLDDTLCFPEGGGQPPDHGWLGGVRVVDVQRHEEGIRHFVERPVEVGAASLVLDWERRFDHMQQHTAQHLLSALALDRFGWATRSFHLGPATSDVELDGVPPADGEIAASGAAGAGALGRAAALREPRGEEPRAAGGTRR